MGLKNFAVIELLCSSVLVYVLLSHVVGVGYGQEQLSVWIVRSTSQQMTSMYGSGPICEHNSIDLQMGLQVQPRKRH